MVSEPLVLGFDTSAAHCAAALLRGERVLACRVAPMARGQVEQLMPLLEEILQEGGASWRDLAAIGVGVGPGNFTGIRISVSAARGLALALEIPAVGVSLFDALAHGYHGACVTAIRGPADKTYVQVMGGGAAPMICAPGQMPDFPARDASALIAFPDVQTLALAHGLQTRPARYPLPVAIARLAGARRHSVRDAPAPLYLKAADAAPARDSAPVILDDDA